MIGQLTEYRTLVTQEFIDTTQKRVDRLKGKGSSNEKRY